MRTARKQTAEFPAWIVLVLFMLALVGVSHSQDVLPAWAPQPYVAVGASLMPNGYSPVAYRLQGGVYEDYKHLVADLYGAYDNGKKTNDGTMNNVAGHDRYLAGFFAYRPKSNTYFGFGPRWNQLTTTNYTKGENVFQAVRDGDFRVQAVVGHDWSHEFSNGHFDMRGQVNYVFTPFHESIAYPATPPAQSVVCSGCGNGVQGPEFTIFLPSPNNPKRHWFFRETLGIYEFHDTYTIPGGYPGERKRHVMATADFMLMYRF